LGFVQFGPIEAVTPPSPIEFKAVYLSDLFLSLFLDREPEIVRRQMAFFNHL
jgi:hypothetical protein